MHPPDVRTFQNHPCIVIWSLGSEAGNGINFEHTYDWLKSVEKNRPVQYERAEQNYNTDIYCRMYRSVDVIKEYLNQKEPKSTVLLSSVNMCARWVTVSAA